MRRGVEEYGRGMLVLSLRSEVKKGCMTEPMRAKIRSRRVRWRDDMMIVWALGVENLPGCFAMQAVNPGDWSRGENLIFRTMEENSLYNL